MIFDVDFKEMNHEMPSCFGNFGNINGAYGNQNFANALKGTASGEVVAVNDVSPLPHQVTAKLRGKNLIPHFIDAHSVTREELTQSCEKGGQTITLNGVGNSSGGGRNNFRDYSQHFVIEKGKTYTLTQEMISGDCDGVYSVYISRMTDYDSVAYVANKETKKTFVANETVECYIGINATSGTVYNNVVVRYQLEEGDTATPYAPYVDTASVKITSCGKNLTSNRATEWNGLYYDLTIENNVMVSVNSEGASNVVLLNKRFPTGTYTANAKFQGLPRYIVRPYNADGTIMSDVVGFGAWNSFYNGYYFTQETQVFAIPENAVYWEFGVVFTSDDATLAGANITISNLQLEIGNTATEFEPYMEKKYSPNDDGIVKITSLSPCMTLLTDTPGTVINCEYNRDTNKALTGNMVTAEGTIVSPNADFAEVAEWADGNPDNEDRTGYFVCANVPVDGIVMKKATSTDDVKGVSIQAPAFAGNYTKDKLDSNGKLLPKYSYVAIIGFVPVIDNGTCTVGGRCMPDDNGCAVPSSNSMGYQVVNRIDEKRVLIIIEPNGDMVQRVKTKINQIETEIGDIETALDNIIAIQNSLIGGGSV